MELATSLGDIQVTILIRLQAEKIHPKAKILSNSRVEAYRRWNTISHVRPKNINSFCIVNWIYYENRKRKISYVKSAYGTKSTINIYGPKVMLVNCRTRSVPSSLSCWNRVRGLQGTCTKHNLIVSNEHLPKNVRKYNQPWSRDNPTFNDRLPVQDQLKTTKKIEIAKFGLIGL